MLPDNILPHFLHSISQNFDFSIQLVIFDTQKLKLRLTNGGTVCRTEPFKRLKPPLKNRRF